MRALLVQAATPPTYWGYQNSLPFIGKKATLPPLGLATLAAHLPQRWELRIRDLHLGDLPDEELQWADVVLVSGMLVQARSMRGVLDQARRLGKRTVVGGPAPTTSPDAFAEADHVFLGEAEGRLDGLVAALESPPDASPRILSPPGEGRPDLGLARVPRFDLVDLEAYATYAIQVSRGCPFNCEFCDIIEIFGRKPRVKSPAQVTAELAELKRLGAQGPLFLVDDNFIGNRKVIAKVLAEVAAWQRANGFLFDLHTEASLDLATEPELLEAMVDAGFSAVFVGIETPNPSSLAEAHKSQNLRMDPAEAVRTLARSGLEVFAGFIVGFDADDEGIFERQREFISSLPIPRAMVGILSALPGTQLWRRLEKEGRLRTDASGDQFDRPNFKTALPEEQLVAGYRWLLASLYSDEAYFARCLRQMRESPTHAIALRRGSFGALARAVWRIGILGERRRWFWRLVREALRIGGLAALSKAVTFSVLAEHLVRYTHEEVLPRLDARLAEMRAERAEPAAAVTRSRPAPDVAPASPERPPRAPAPLFPASAS
jgi:radical SAM superfamily enzyme YgiQ (UPF0313 family)